VAEPKEWNFVPPRFVTKDYNLRVHVRGKLMTLETNLPAVSIAIIGKNEAANIRECILSVLEMDYPQELLEIMYIDTGSTDGTQEIAKTLGVRVVEVLSKTPSAALARNIGLSESRNEIIHFIDGDMTIASSYLRKAVDKLASGDMVCVFGRVVEKRADINWISRMLSVDWKTKEGGYANAPGGGGTFLKSVLQQIGGYNNGLTLAEETDIGIRLRNIGQKIYMIDDTMAIHDYGVNNFRELVKRYYGQGRGRFRTMIASNVPLEIRKWSYSLPLQAAVMLILMAIMIYYGYLSATIILMALYPVIYFIRVIITDWKYIVTRKYGLNAFLYSYIYYIMKPVILWGIFCEFIVYTVKRFGGKQTLWNL
jgi:glycosyltransferase involved in cell wall biosynthesis